MAFSTEFVLDATHYVITAYGNAVMRFESGSPERLAECWVSADFSTGLWLPSNHLRG